MPGPILVSDFDGTITKYDFYRLILEQGLPAETPDFWSQYLSRHITHFEAINKTFGAAPFGIERLIELADQMEPDPDLGPCVRSLIDIGWSFVIASAGCRWYIDRILTKAEVPHEVEVHANPGSVVDDRLVMTLPQHSRFYSPETGINKVAIVERALAGGGDVAFAGDGPPDVEPALLVKPELRFARGYLAEELTERGVPFRPYHRWAEVANTLIALDLNQ